MKAGMHAVRAAASGHAFAPACALLFAASAAATIAGCASMTAMGALPMRGGWAMSMAWLPGCGQRWPGVAAAWLGMWVAMTLAMMLPAVAPMLWRCRQAVGRAGAAHPDRLAARVGAGYLMVWIACGMAAWMAGVALAALALRWPLLARAVPAASGVIVLLAGMLQCSAWKARRLACCRAAPGCGLTLPLHAAAAWRYGLRLGRHCSACCAGLTATLLVLGVMDLRMMAAVTTAIALERLAPAGARMAQLIGAVMIAAGLCLLALAAGPG